MNANEVERCFGLYGKSVISAALVYVKDPTDADDIAQEVFFKLYRYSGSFDSDEHIKAWLIRCAINQCKDHLRSPWRRLSLPLEAAADKHTEERSGDDYGMLDVMRKLGRSNRITLYMYYYEDYSADEIADILGISVNAVHSRLKRGRQQLKKLLEKKSKEADNGLQKLF